MSICLLFLFFIDWQTASPCHYLPILFHKIQVIKVIWPVNDRMNLKSYIQTFFQDRHFYYRCLIKVFVKSFKRNAAVIYYLSSGCSKKTFYPYFIWEWFKPFLLNCFALFWHIFQYYFLKSDLLPYCRVQFRY